MNFYLILETHGEYTMKKNAMLCENLRHHCGRADLRLGILFCSPFTAELLSIWERDHKKYSQREGQCDSYTVKVESSLL